MKETLQNIAFIFITLVKETLQNIAFIFITLVVFGGLFAMVCVSIKQSDRCNDLCNPDPIQHCYKDRVVCVGQDKLYVKMNKKESK